MWMFCKIQVKVTIIFFFWACWNKWYSMIVIWEIKMSVVGIFPFQAGSHVLCTWPALKHVLITTWVAMAYTALGVQHQSARIMLRSTMEVPLDAEWAFLPTGRRWKPAAIGWEDVTKFIQCWKALWHTECCFVISGRELHPPLLWTYCNIAFLQINKIVSFWKVPEKHW